MRTAIQPFMKQGAEPPPVDDVEVMSPSQGFGPNEVLSEEMLVAEAVRANVAMTDLNIRLDNLSRQLQRKVRVMGNISDFGVAVSNERDPAKVLRLLITNAIRLLQLQGASVLVVSGSGLLREAVVHGFTKDPLMSSAGETEPSVIARLLDAKKPELVAPGNENDEESMLLSVVEKSGFASAAAIPLVTQDRVVGLLTVYGDNERAILDEDDLQLATVLASTAAMGYANAIAWKQMQEFSKGLEATVEERTAELRKTLAESRRLTTDLGEKNSLLDSAYRELEALDGVKNELINRLSLDLRTPVTSLSTAAKILRRDKGVRGDKTERLVTVIHDEAEKLLEIIQSIFQASVLSTGASDLKRSPVPAQDLFRKAIAPLRDLAKERQVKVHVLIPSGLESICCEPDSSEAALRAVIKNGIEFNRPGGDVKLEVRRVMRGKEPWLHFRVADTGTGISDRDLPRVCEPFYQGDDSGAGKRHGIGLGLAIAKRVMENHGGSITITSNPNDGTEIVMAIPQTED
jgi:signal transduction histidine kinase